VPRFLVCTDPAGGGEGRKWRGAGSQTRPRPTRQTRKWRVFPVRTLTNPRNHMWLCAVSASLASGRGRLFVCAIQLGLVRGPGEAALKKVSSPTRAGSDRKDGQHQHRKVVQSTALAS